MVRPHTSATNSTSRHVEALHLLRSRSRPVLPPLAPAASTPSGSGANRFTSLKVENLLLLLPPSSSSSAAPASTVQVSG